ncbi:MAG: BREX system P-loop protein BrxC [Acidobacteria bacterium]|nr:BREX system P-loop protein BrxC [Acidobacteriota bacterium]
MKIHDILDRDPRSEGLANKGQARLDDDGVKQAVLREELSTFVCDGRFGEGLTVMLDRYVGNLDRSRQEAAWISGFFGSGKSHLLKMAAHLWVNTAFEDGSTARTLVRAAAPDEVFASLRELDTLATRLGHPPVAAAGTLLGGNEQVRRTVLDIILCACGWPGRFELAEFHAWLVEEGAYEAVRGVVEAADKSWDRELNSLWVSPVIARATAEAVPSFAADGPAALAAFRAQFPSTADADITTEQFVAAARRALSTEDGIAPTVLVLDEVQQYIGNSEARSSAVTEVAEAICTGFDSRVLLIGAGQSALSADTPLLAKLRDRFRIRFELTDADVEAVTRKVLLRKKQSARPAVEELFELHAGEVSRHLRQTKIGPRPEDEKHRVNDYPLLPARRRFWEECFRAVDPGGGGHSQLRSQLRILDESLRNLATKKLGAVIPAADLWNSLADDLVSGGILLNELHTRIRTLDDGTDAGRLRRDLCGLVFLVGRLPQEGGLDTGVRADAETLADLMVNDITIDAGELRRTVSRELQSLADRAVLLKVGNEFRLQTREGQEWEQAWNEARRSLRGDDGELTRIRGQLLGQAAEGMVTSRLTHGKSKIRRTVTLHRSDVEPPGGDAVVVWLRDAWSANGKAVEMEARTAGASSSTLFAFVPMDKARDEELKEAILAVAAAQRVLDRKGTPATDEGQEARAGMESRMAEARRRRDELVAGLLRSAVVWQGGGAEVHGEDLGEKVAAAAPACLARLFPEFDRGDHRSWPTAVTRARQGNDQPLVAVAWTRPVEEHPVAREVLDKVGAGARGAEVRRVLEAPPFGWPRDAIDACLLALHASRHLRATRNGAPVAPGTLDQGTIQQSRFRPEKVVLGAQELIALRGLFQKAGVQTKPGQEEQTTPLFVAKLRELAHGAGGDAPLPPRPDTAFLDDLARLTGPEQLEAILSTAERIRESLTRWRALSQRLPQREAAWRRLDRLLHHARGLPCHPEVETEVQAISSQRSLLEESDPTSPLCQRLASELRSALSDRRAALDRAVADFLAQLDAVPAWGRLEPGQRAAILSEHRLAPPAQAGVSSDEELLRALDERSLTAWDAEIDAVPARQTKALAEALRLVAPPEDAPSAPTTVTLRRDALADEAAVRAWLREHEERLLEAVRKGPVILH